MVHRGRHCGLKILLTLLTSLLVVAGAWACPVPHDADSAYHTMSRLLKISPRLGVRTTADTVSRDPQDITPCEGGMAGIYPCNNVDLMSFLPISGLGGDDVNDIWGWTDPLNGNEYALIGQTGGTAFVNITEPEHPVYLGSLPTHTVNSSWRDVKTYGNYAYIVSEAAGHGMQVFDLTELRNVVTARSYSETSHYAEFGSAHNIIINEDTGYAYAVGTRNDADDCGGGLHMIDITQPATPEFAGCYAGDGYTHDAQCVVYSGPDPDYQGKEICFNYNEDTLTIVDVSDKAAPSMLARVTYSGASYTHQGWLTEDQVYLLLDDEGDELSFAHNTRTYIWDVSDLDLPQTIGSFLAPVGAIDHNQYIKGDFSYQANYRAGLRILDISSIAAGSLVQNGFFDVYPPSDSVGYNGSWSVYPYFDSGVVIVSGIELGLFVLRPTALEPGFILTSDEQNLQVCGDDIVSAVLNVDRVGSYVGDVDLMAAGAPPGVATVFSPSQLTPSANSIFAANVTGAEPGVYPITLTATDGTLEFDQLLTLSLSQVPPDQPDLLLPGANATQVSGIQTLYWSATAGAFSYDLEVATDPAFSNTVLFVPGIVDRSYVPPAALVTETLHYWRVTANNACGSVTSTVGSFTTGGSQCQIFVSNNVPVAINGTETVTSTLTATAPGTIVDVNVVALQATHSWINDLDIKLEGPLSAAVSRHPERQSVQIMVQSCSNEDNLDINFDDEAAAGPIPCPPTDGGTYQPSNPLSGFDGASGSGEWNLLVTDNFVADDGTLDNWGLEICTAPDSLILDIDNDAVDDRIDNCLNVANPAQRDTDTDGFGNMCDGDFNNDGIVNFPDLAVMQADFFLSGDFDTDMDGDGIVNFNDLGILQQSFFGPPGPSGLIL